ncbi:aminoacyltransferase [Streptococcus sp. sy004]|uniref:aminoacyltransferase n=1 Tax=Streptococcus sp. sy004 TaxID=2600149 RepID=UPI0011B47132|nr:aminoacyltransferase [Streptococcus sp. sy004]TWT10440.1 aminoacyltransferase [Streptococcus sp. sy004]
MFSYKIGISQDEHDTFVQNHPQANLLQSSKWAKIKDNWGNQRVGFYRNQELVASASILIRKLPLGFTMLYIPRGPIMDYNDEELVSFVFKSLKAFGRKQRAIFIKFDPNLHLRTNQIGQDPQEKTDAQKQIALLQAKGAQWTGLTTDISDNIQPRFQANLYADHYDLADFHKKTKQIIRVAQNKGVTIQFGHLNLVEDFTELMKKTETRKQIHLRNKDYYTKLLETYGEQAYITMAFLNLTEKQEQFSSELAKAQATFAEFTENTHKNKVKNTQNEINRLQKELDFIQTELEKGRSMVPLAATLSLNFGPTSENLYAGMDEIFRSYNAPLLTWHQTAQHAFDMGITWQNMGGVENDLSGGLYNFKSKLNPTIEEFIGEFNLPINPVLYRLFMLAYAGRKKLRKKN